MIDHEAGAVDLNSANIKSHRQSRKSYQDFISYLKEGAQRWQHFGVLSAMHYLLDQKPLCSRKAFGKALAAHPEGDHMMDFQRHVMDILAQYGIGMGE